MQDSVTLNRVRQAQCPDHVALALEAAEKSAVLLTNSGILPLNSAELQTVAVLGRLAGLENTGDHGSSRVQPPHLVTPLDGLRARLGEGMVIATGAETDIPAATLATASADVVIIVAGFTAEEEGEWIPEGGIDPGAAVNPMVKTLMTSAPKPESNGEQASLRSDRGGDRMQLSLPKNQVALINAASSTGKPVVVVLVAGSAVIVEDWIDAVDASLVTFYAGMEGGTALARLLLGDVSPSGRLPFTVATSADDYPFLDKDADLMTRIICKSCGSEPATG